MTTDSFQQNIILASASPRRVELMTFAGIPFTAIPADICEEPLSGESADSHVLRLSREKAAAVAAIAEGDYVIGADTIVVLDEEILGKPLDTEDAARMLARLSGRTHRVITGFTLYDREKGRYISRSVSTQVTFKELAPAEISAYVATGCPLDKAGAYAIQGGAVHFVRQINGSYTNVIGLPMTELYELLQESGALE